MSAAIPEFLQCYRERFAAVMVKRQEPDTLAKRRRAALDGLEKRGLPTRHQEAWRFADLSAVYRGSWQRPEKAQVEGKILPTLHDTRTHKLTFINGRFAPQLSRLGDLRGKTLIASLGQALLTHPELLEPHLDRLPGLQKHPFAALNSAFWEDGALVYVARDTQLDKPIHLIFHTTGDQIAVHPRLLVVLEPEAQATLVVEYGGQGSYFNSPMLELAVANNALLHYCQVQEEAAQALHLGTIRIHQQRDSHVNLHLMGLGGQWSRIDIEALLAGDHINCQINGLTVGHARQFSDHQVRIEHAGLYGTSGQTFKSILDDQAHSVFDGMVYVGQQAQKTDARQLSSNLLLSRHARAQSNPRLEILADDVQCGHGSTTGFLDPDAEFYLRARGIPAAQARALLVRAFANDNLVRIPVTALRERLVAQLMERLNLSFLEHEENR